MKGNALMANKQAASKKPVSGKQAAALANFLKKGSAKTPPKATSAVAPDAEDAADGGADEAQE